jgi:hypothetical protein
MAASPPIVSCANDTIEDAGCREGNYQLPTWAYARHEQIPASWKAFDLIGDANVAALRMAGVGRWNVGQAASQVEISAIVLSGNCLVNALAACARSKFYVCTGSQAAFVSPFNLGRLIPGS